MVCSYFFWLRFRFYVFVWWYSPHIEQTYFATTKTTSLTLYVYIPHYHIFPLVNDIRLIIAFVLYFILFFVCSLRFFLFHSLFHPFPFFFNCGLQYVRLPIGPHSFYFDTHSNFDCNFYSLVLFRCIFNFRKFAGKKRLWC